MNQCKLWNTYIDTQIDKNIYRVKQEKINKERIKIHIMTRMYTYANTTLVFDDR